MGKFNPLRSPVFGVVFYVLSDPTWCSGCLIGLTSKIWTKIPRLLSFPMLFWDFESNGNVPYKLQIILKEPKILCAVISDFFPKLREIPCQRTLQFIQEGRHPSKFSTDCWCSCIHICQLCLGASHLAVDPPSNQRHALVSPTITLRQTRRILLAPRGCPFGGAFDLNTSVCVWSCAGVMLPKFNNFILNYASPLGRRRALK